MGEFRDLTEKIKCLLLTLPSLLAHRAGWGSLCVDTGITSASFKDGVSARVNLALQRSSPSTQ